jgi:hypothetical protein
MDGPRQTLVLLRRLFTGSILVYATVSLSLGGTRASWPAFYCILPVLFCGLLWFRKRIASSFWEIAGFNLALTLALAEVGLRSAGYVTGTSLIVSNALDGYRLGPGQDYGAGLKGNSLGYPGGEFRREKTTGVFRIAAIGDSFAVGPAVPFAENYLTLLQTRLPGAEVYNFGVSGAGPREYETILNRDVWQFEPDCVLLSVFVGNDITESLATPRHMDPRQHAVYLFLSRLGRLLQERSRQQHGEQPASNERIARPALSKETFLEVEARRLAICWTDAVPGLEKRWHQALAHLDGIAAGCTKHDCPLFVVLIPDEFQVNPEVLNQALHAAGVQKDRFDRDLPQRRLGAFFAERGVACLDLLPEFRDTRDAYAPYDTHWNVKGNRLAADRIVRWFGRPK